MIKNKFHVIFFYILETILQTCRIQNTPWQQAQISCFTSSNSSKCYPRFGVDFFPLIDWDVSLKIGYNPNSLAFHGISFWGPHLQTIPCVEDWQSVAVIYTFFFAKGIRNSQTSRSETPIIQPYLSVPPFIMMQYLGEEHVREKMKFNGCIMWIKQCHKPAHLGMVYTTYENGENWDGLSDYPTLILYNRQWSCGFPH